MHENNDHLLAGAWWVIVNSPDSKFLFLHRYLSSPEFSGGDKDFFSMVFRMIKFLCGKKKYKEV